MYKTVQGDCWDMIAKKVYGTEIAMSDLLKANRAYRNYAIFPAGVELETPDISIKVANSGLPPWKQATQG